MSDRNTGLFLAGNVDDQTIVEAFSHARELKDGLLVGDEAPRVGRGIRDGHAYTHVALRLFEVAGLRLMDDDTLPPVDDLEQILGVHLSRAAGRAVFAFYDEEHGAGGAAVYEKGQLVSRDCHDARETAPVHRGLKTTVPLGNLDPSDWIWRPASDTIEAAMLPLVGPGVRTDDDIVALIEAAGAANLPETPPPATPPKPRKRDALRTFARSWLRR